MADNKVWFITGCSTGFGRELAKMVLDRGYRTVVTARDPAKVEDIAAPYGDRALVLPLDVTDPVEIDAAVKSAEKRFGKIDVLVNNAGIGYFGAVEESDEAEVRRMFEINFFGLSAMTRAALPGMRKSRKGQIVNRSSRGSVENAERVDLAIEVFDQPIVVDNVEMYRVPDGLTRYCKRSAARCFSAPVSRPGDIHSAGRQCHVDRVPWNQFQLRPAAGQRRRIEGTRARANSNAEQQHGHHASHNASLYKTLLIFNEDHCIAIGIEPVLLAYGFLISPHREVVPRERGNQHD